MRDKLILAVIAVIFIGGVLLMFFSGLIAPSLKAFPSVYADTAIPVPGSTPIVGLLLDQWQLDARLGTMYVTADPRGEIVCFQWMRSARTPGGMSCLPAASTIYGKEIAE